MNKKRRSNEIKFPGFLKREMEKKMRYLIFGKSTDTTSVIGMTHITNYETLYDFLYNAATNPNKAFGKTDSRVYGRVLNKLEAIGDVGKVRGFDLKPFGGTVALEEQEYAILASAIDSVEWAAGGTRKADELYTWFDAAPKELPKVVEDAPTINEAVQIERTEKSATS